jgi:hypothetical protein
MIDWNRIANFPLSEEELSRIERVALEVTKLIVTECETATEAMAVLAAVSAGTMSMVTEKRKEVEVSTLALVSKGNA